MLTPFHQDGGIDWRSYVRYVEWQASKQPSAMFAVCGSSEMKWLTRHERFRLIEETVKHGGETPVIATANLEPDLREHPEEVKHVADLGVAAAVLVPPPQISGDVDRYRDYLINLSEQITCPVFVYEWPQVANHLMDIRLFGELAQRGVIAGIKDTTCTYEGIAAKQQTARDVIVYQANTPYLLNALTLGVGGIMAVTSTTKADLVIALWDAYQNSTDHMVALHRELVYLDALLRLAYPATAKFLVGLQGIEMSTATRWPVRLMPESCKALEVWNQQYLEKQL
jgi:4-hydroxy-tetrahydrodipicolinate synthase